MNRIINWKGLKKEKNERMKKRKVDERKEGVTNKCRNNDERNSKI
jgi:hypothetical protein